MSQEKSAQLQYLVGVDALGRSFGPAAVSPGKTVGMFFWLWIGQPYASGVYDAGELLKLPNGQQVLFHASSEQSPDRQAHFWGKPLWGYYNSADPWVVSKQLELLTLAGVDYIVFDGTNAMTYPEVYAVVMQTIERFQKAGWNPPKAAFYTHTYSMKTVRKLYEELYRPGLYRSAWYCEHGKPMIIAYTDPEEDLKWVHADGHDQQYAPEPFSDEILEFFRFRKPLWPLDPYDPEGFPWVEWTFPQPVHGDMMSVSVASHPNVPFSFTLTRGVENWGRGWDGDAKYNRPEKVTEGIFFERQWERALEVMPPMVFVGGWNEWIAYKQIWQGEYMLCDAANREFSRDIEPMCGGHEDAFYLQLMRNMRRYRGTPVPKPNGSSVIYEAMPTAPARDSFGVSRTVHYTQAVPNNPLQQIAVSQEEGILQFCLTFSQKLTEDVLHSAALYLGTGEPHPGAWESYDWKVAFDGGWKLTALSDGRSQPVEFFVDDRRLTLRVSMAALQAAHVPMIYFKAISEIADPENDIMRTYTQGCAMPPGRLSYAYPLR